MLCLIGKDVIKLAENKHKQTYMWRKMVLLQRRSSTRLAKVAAVVAEVDWALRPSSPVS